jgi:peptide/nickel transport system permease protein
VLGLLGLYVFAVRWHLLPVGHYEDLALPLLWSADWFRALAADPWYVVGDLAWHLILPVFVLIVTGVAIDSRFMRASMLQVIRQDYVRTARAKGLSGMRVLLKHALRNALLPILTNMALYLPSFVGGVIVVEIVFTWGGLGYAFGSALSEGDGTFLQAVLVLSTLTVVLANLLADLSYGWLDPRVRYE